jgi:hypothetical protein
LGPENPLNILKLEFYIIQSENKKYFLKRAGSVLTPFPETHTAIGK